MGTNRKGKFGLNIRRKFFTVSGETLEEVAQEGCGCTNPGSVQRQSG